MHRSVHNYGKNVFYEREPIMLKAWKIKMILKHKCRGKGIHGTHVYYCRQGKTFSSYELMLLIASALLFDTGHKKTR